MKYQCDHCGNLLTSALVERHECEPKRKFELAQTTLGRTAFFLWNDWLQLKGLSPQSSECFAESMYFQNFIDFARFVRENDIEHPSKYLTLMVESEITPVAFERAECLQAYRERVESITVPTPAPAAYDEKGKRRKEFPKELQEWLTQRKAK